MSLRRSSNCPTCRCTCGYCSNIPPPNSSKGCPPQKSGQKTIYLRLVAASECGESNSTNNCECGESSTKCVSCQNSGESCEDCECDGQESEETFSSGCGRTDCLCQMFKDNGKEKFSSGNQCVVSGQPICCHYCFGDEMENCQQNSKRTCPEKKPWVPAGRSQCGRGSYNSPRPCQNQQQQRQPQPITIRVCPINIQQQCRR